MVGLKVSLKHYLLQNFDLAIVIRFREKAKGKKSNFSSLAGLLLSRRAPTGLSYLDYVPLCAYVLESNLAHCTFSTLVANCELEPCRILHGNREPDSDLRQTSSQNFCSRKVSYQSKPTFYPHTLCLEDYLSEVFHKLSSGIVPKLVDIGQMR